MTNSSETFNIFLEILVKTGNVEAAKLLKPDIDTSVFGNIPQDKEEIMDVEFEISHDPSNVVITASGSKSGENYYDMSKNPRGYCLIINNVAFENDTLERRDGSLKDAKRCKDVFEQLGFRSFIRHNQKKDQILKLCKNLSNMNDHQKMNALVVVVLSHGATQNIIWGSDNLSVDVMEMIGCFNNKNCPALIDKPKMFFICACRGGENIK